MHRDNKRVKFQGVSYSVSEPHRVSNAAAFADLLNGLEGIIVPRLQKRACWFFFSFFLFYWELENLTLGEAEKQRTRFMQRTPTINPPRINSS